MYFHTDLGLDMLVDCPVAAKGANGTDELHGGGEGMALDLKVRCILRWLLRVRPGQRGSLKTQMKSTCSRPGAIRPLDWVQHSKHGEHRAEWKRTTMFRSNPRGVIPACPCSLTEMLSRFKTFHSAPRSKGANTNRAKKRSHRPSRQINSRRRIVPVGK